MQRINSASGRLVCEGNVLHQGRTVATAEGRIHATGGRLVAHGTATCLILQPRNPDPAQG